MDPRQANAGPVRPRSASMAGRRVELVLLICGSLALVAPLFSVARSNLYQRYAHARFDSAVREKITAASTVAGLSAIPDIRAVPSPEGDGALNGFLTPPALARLEIPSLGLSVMVLEGTDAMTLNQGVGRIEGTAKLGEPGNLGIAGHRDSFFRSIGDLAARDEIILTTLDGQQLRYAVERTEIVNPDRVDVLDPSETHTLTLVTCYPFRFIGPAPLRFVVMARRVDGEDGRRVSQHF